MTIPFVFQNVRRLLAFALLFSLTFGLFPAQAHSDGEEHGFPGAIKPSISVTKAWVRMTPRVARNSAAYFQLDNHGNKDLTLVDVTTTAAKSATMHETLFEKNMAKMVAIPALTIAAKSSVEFVPGGKHLMLVDLTEPLNENTQIAVTFKFDNGQSLVADLIVKRDADDENQHHHH